MNKTKNHNSILFLTTLSVYLGLVLVGATPSVLAQQAVLTQKFEIKKEIEVEDDLDKNPDDDEIKQFFEIGLENALATFVEDLKQLKQSGKYKKNEKRVTSIECWHSFLSDEIANASKTPTPNTWVTNALDKLHGNLDTHIVRNFNGKNSFAKFSSNDLSKECGLKLRFDKNQLRLEINFSQESAPIAVASADYLNNIFLDKKLGSDKILPKLIYENTKAKTDNQYVLVTTKLPRAAIDEILADKDAK